MKIVSFRRVLPGLALMAVAALLVAAQATSAAPTQPSPGCKGIATAMSNAEKGTKGQAALAVVSEKLGCATTPPPVDVMACPSGETTLSNWVFNAETGEYSLVDGSAPPAPNEYGGTDKGGFYIDGGPAPSSVVLQSTTGQVVTVTYGAGKQVETGQAISQNWFNPDVMGGRTGIQLIRFCGSTVDPMACPSGETKMSDWAFNPATGEYSNTSGSTSPAPNEYGGTDKGGFYIDGGPAPTSVVLQSTTGQIVTVTYGAGKQVETGQAISQNWFDPDVMGGRTGIQLIRFCGPAA